MNILLVVPWDQEFGGVASVVGNLARYLVKQNHGVLFLHLGSRNILRRRSTKWGFTDYSLRLRVPIVKGHSFRSLLAFFTFLPSTLMQLIYLLLTHRVEVINAHYASGAFFYLAICSRVLGIKLVTSIHGADIFPGGKPLGKISRSMKFLLFSSDCIVAPSKAFLREFLGLFPNLRDKGSFIHNGVNIFEMNHFPERHEGEGEKKYLLCIAAHNEKKGIDVLIHAFSLMKAYDASIRLVLVGDGPLRGQHEALTKVLGLQERVSFLGDRGRSEVVKLIHGCEVLILASRSEPFGIVVIEAMACRKPVVATKVGGIPEIVEDGKNGILVEANNPNALTKAILSVLKDENLRKSLATNGYMRVSSKFRCEHTGSKYENLFSKLLGGVES